MKYLDNLFLHRALFAFYMLNGTHGEKDLDALTGRYASFFCADGECRALLRKTFENDAFRRAVDRPKTYLLARICEYDDEKFSPFEIDLIPRMVAQVDAVTEIFSHYPVESSPLYVLEHAANGGDVRALCLMAFLVNEGTVFEKDEQAAEALIERGVRSQVLDCVLMKLRRGPDEYCSCALKAMLGGPSTKSVFDELCASSFADKNAERYGSFTRSLERVYDEGVLSRGKIEVTVLPEAVELLAQAPEKECLAALKSAILACRSAGLSEVTREMAEARLKTAEKAKIGF